MMMTLRDEILVAYADNELSADVRRAVEHVLAVDQEARSTVALFKLTGYQLRQAFLGIDFTGVPDWIEELLARDAGSRQPDAGVPPVRPLRPKLAMAFAASGLAAICLGTMGYVWSPPPTGAGDQVALGVLPADAALSQALDHLSRAGSEWTVGEGWRAVEISSFKDRFDNECREVGIVDPPSADVPARIFVACRNATHRWSVVGAVTNQAAGSPGDAYYVPTEGEARASLSSVLSMLGAQQLSSATDRKTTMP
jgi:hypothetical protein